MTIAPWRGFALAVFLFLCFPLPSTYAQSRPTLKVEDYAQWEGLGTAMLSPDGIWFAYEIQHINNTYELHYRKVDEPASSEKTVASANSPQFSVSARWLAYSIGFSEEEREKRQKANQSLQGKVGLVDLSTGQTTTLDDVASFAFSDSGDYLALRGYPIKGRQSKGADLVVRDLTTGTDTNFGNVSAFAWQNKGSLLALTIDAENKVGNGVQVFDPRTGVLRTLDSTNKGTYINLSWRRKSDDLAVLRSFTKEEYEKPGHALLAIRGLSGATLTKKVYIPADDTTFPAETRLTEAPLIWQEEGAAIFFGIAPWKKKPNPPKPADAAKPPADALKPGDAPKPEDAPKPDAPKPDTPKPAPRKDMEPAGVEVWHTRDTDIMPMQKKTADADRQRSNTAVWWLESGKFVQLTKNRYEDLSLTKQGRIGVIQDANPYQKDRMFSYDKADLYRIETETGARTLIQRGIVSPHIVMPSRGGASKTLLYVSDKNLMAVDLLSGKTTDITKGLSLRLLDDDPEDYGGPVKFPYGIGGWTKDDASVLIYDQFDIWELKTDGSGGKRLTDGAKEKIRHRLLGDFDPDSEFVDRTKPLYVSLYGDTSKWSGYGRLNADTGVTHLQWQNRRINRLMKAKDTERFAFVTQDSDDSPDWYICGADFANPQQISATNMQQAKFAWTRSELVNFKNRQGKALQGSLFYPANYEPGKQYPMIVYIYEKLSESVHVYPSPSERSAYNPAVFTQAGYFVFNPDIVYRVKNPGLSAVDCVVPAVEEVIKSGKVDPKRIGLVGHSWGAYQTAFIVTQTNIFAAGIAGAPLTDLISMYLSIYWNSGSTDARIFEISQGRMAGPPWDAMKEYMANSPLFNLKTLNTPLLVAFGNQDGAVDWHQGIELYNAARRVDKQVVMLVYDGENHGLAKKPNQIDYHNRIMQWFGHYLKSEKAEKWITDGTSYLEREDEIARQKPPTPATP